MLPASPFPLYMGPQLDFDQHSETTMKYFIQLFLGVVCAAHALAAESQIIAPGATLQKLAGGVAFTEGPACDREGNVFFTDQPNDRILKWSVDGKLSTFLQPSGRANGMCFDAKGNLIACAEGR